MTCSGLPSISIRTSSLLNAARAVNEPVSARSRLKHGYGGGPDVPAFPAVSRKTSSFGLWTGSDLSNTASMRLNTAVLAPTPSAIVKDAAAVNARALPSDRIPKRRSCPN